MIQASNGYCLRFSSRPRCLHRTAGSVAAASGAVRGPDPVLRRGDRRSPDLASGGQGARPRVEPGTGGGPQRGRGGRRGPPPGASLGEPGVRGSRRRRSEETNRDGTRPRSPGPSRSASRSSARGARGPGPPSTAVTRRLPSAEAVRLDLLAEVDRRFAGVLVAQVADRGVGRRVTASPSRPCGP